MLVTRSCIVCGNDFKVQEWFLNRGRGKTCSKKCMGISNIKSVTGNCSQCGKEILIQRYKINKDKHHFCSNECAWNFKKKQKISDEHKERLRKKAIGRSPPNKGKPCPEYLKHIIAAKLRKNYIDYQWYGSVKYNSIPDYCEKWTLEFRERVRAFFNYQCVECGAIQTKKKLSIHHVNYNKNTCCNNEERLFVSLCKSCHAKTNYDRKYWKDHFKEIINNYYGGKCYFTKEEYKQWCIDA